MRVHHRVPSIFNLSMVDVLCCALGCVLLLWLVNLRDARDRAETASETGRLLTATQAKLEETARTASETRERQAAAEDLARKLSKERDQIHGDLLMARARLAKLDEQTAVDAEKLSKLDKEKVAALRRITDLEVLSREKEKLASSAGRRAEELVEQLLDLEKKLKRATPLADLVPGLRRDIEQARAKLSASEKRAQGLEKDLSTASQRITALQGEQSSLSDQVARARAAAENRFAGIELTGRRVVFLVDISGSMQYVDADTASPAKWPAVREAVVKVLRSLPDLETFQLILFSDKVTTPLGGDRRWIKYTSTSGEEVVKALSAVTPKGNTNLYAALEAAFHFREQGMDTIYLFSDGLPNLGEGLTPAQAQSTQETEKATALGKYVRTRLRTDWNAAAPNRPRVRINAIGFFYESPDLGAFLWALSRENEGSFVGMSRP